MTGFALNRRKVLSALATLPFSGAARAEEAELIAFAGLYKSFGVLGYEFADRVRALAGKQVAMAGYMAPPLTAEGAFFVLTREPLAICPFCQSDADWPVDILVVYLEKMTPLVTAGAKVLVAGQLEVGSWADPETGFVSQIRLRHGSYRRA